MVKTFERSLLLHVGKMVVPFKFSDQCDPLRTERKKGNQAKRSNNFGTGPGQRWPVSDSGAFFRDSGRRHQFQPDEFSASACGGMIRGRFPGLAKKRKTRSIGTGTHCSNCARWTMRFRSRYNRPRRAGVK